MAEQEVEKEPVEKCYSEPNPGELTEIAKRFKSGFINHRDKSVFMHLAKDVKWELVTYGMAIEGRESLEESMTNSFGFVEEAKFEYVSSVEIPEARQVIMERISHFKMEGKWFQVPVCDIVAFDQDKKIIHWREYHTLEYLKDLRNPPIAPVEALDDVCEGSEITEFETGTDMDFDDIDEFEDFIILDGEVRDENEEGSVFKFCKEVYFGMLSSISYTFCDYQVGRNQSTTSTAYGGFEARPVRVNSCPL